MMKNNNLRYFIGKVCTIFTHPINRNFKDENPETFKEQPLYYFIGVIDEVDENGILVTQVLTGLKSYFFMQGLISIAEEEVLDPQNSNDAQIIDDMKITNEQIKEKNQFVNIEAMSNMLKNIK